MKGKLIFIEIFFLKNPITKNQKPKKMHFTPFLSLRWTAWWPYRLSHINALRINLSYLPKDQSLRFSRKNTENWSSWGMTFFWFLVIGFFKIFVLFFPNENQLGFHMRYHLFLDSFFRIVKKTSWELVCTRLYNVQCTYLEQQGKLESLIISMSERIKNIIGK